MLRKIPVDQVRLGMYIHEFSGSWIDHPFWRSAFTLDGVDVLQLLLKSQVREVVIDTSKGLDVLLDEISQASIKTDALEANTTISHTHQTIQKISAKAERDQARKILNASKVAITSMFKEVRMGGAFNSENALPLVEEISASVSRNSSALISLVRLKNKDDYTYMHSVAVCALMIALGRELKLSEDEIKQAGLGGLLHDIGKAAVPLDILNKPGTLTVDEFDTVRQHPMAGHAILKSTKGMSQIALDVCLHHHEKIDGSGYPQGLPTESISLFAKMGAVCDVYDAVTSNRCYKDGWEPAVAIKRMAQWTNHFDSVVFKAFVKSVGIYPTGSLVKLKSGRLALVVDQSKSLLKPVIKVFFSYKSMAYIPTELIDMSSYGCRCEILGYEDPVIWGIHDLEKIWNL